MLSRVDYGSMTPDLSEPKTRLEWSVFAGLVIAFYTVVMPLTAGGIRYSLVMGFIYGLPLTAMLVVLVDAWRIVTESADHT
jgi:flagellar biosynthesis protein FliP